MSNLPCRTNAFVLPLVFLAILLACATPRARAQTACYPAWNATAIYVGGNTASSNGVNYTANWWTQGQNPATNNGGSGSGEPWTSNGTCSGSSGSTGTGSSGGSSTGSACNSDWSATAIYVGGNTASVNGVNYTANFWTQGQNPATNNGGSGSGEPWTSNGTCSSGGTGTGSGGGTSTGGGAGTGGSTPPAATGALFAPYVDMGLTNAEQLVSLQQQSGFKAVTLAFLVASGSGCQAGWGGLGGTLPTDTFPNGTSIQSIVQSLKAAGVQVIISFGGANGTEPALACGNASSLQALYQSVINRYGVTMLDFDIEGAATTDQASITRRDQAVVALKNANPGLVISYTLPVLPTGLIDSGVNILKSAKADGLALNTVNIMAMDYGSSVDNGGKMGLDAIDAAQATASQIAAAGLTSSVGITPMIGVNDTNTEIFQLSDAQTVLNFAESTSYIGRLSIWSLARDNGSCPGQTWASPTCSGVSQNNFQFIENFNAFNSR